MGNDVGPPGRGSQPERVVEAHRSADPEAAAQVNAATRPAGRGPLQGLGRVRRFAEQAVRSVTAVKASPWHPIQAARYRRASEFDSARYDQALEDVDRVGNATAAHEFIENYLQPDSWPLHDHRGELILRLLQRIPEISDASDTRDEQVKVFRAVLRVACEVPEHQQRKVFAALTEAARSLPMTRQLRKEISMSAELLRSGGRIDDSDYLAIHVKLAREIASAVPFDAQPLDELRSGNGPQTDVDRTELSRLSQRRISNESDAKELASIFRVTLGVVREMPVEQKGAWLTALGQATSCLSRYPNELANLLEPMLEVTPGLADEDQGGVLPVLAEISSHLPVSATGLRAELLKCARAAWERKAIDARVYAEILATTLPLATAGVDLRWNPGGLDRFVEAIKELPPEHQGRPYASLFSREVSRWPDVWAEPYFKKAWEGLKDLEWEHAEEGIEILGATGMQFADASLGGTIVKSMLDKIEESPDSQWHRLLLRAMAPIIAFPSRGATSSLERELSMIDRRAPVRVSDFLLSSGYWMATHCALIFDHMYPLVMDLSNEEERASELTALAILLRGPEDRRLLPNPSEETKARHEMLVPRFNKIVVGLKTVTKTSLRSDPLIYARDLAEQLPPAERPNARKRLDQLRADDARR